MNAEERPQNANAETTALPAAVHVIKVAQGADLPALALLARTLSTASFTSSAKRVGAYVLPTASRCISPRAIIRASTMTISKTCTASSWVENTLISPKHLGGTPSAMMITSSSGNRRGWGCHSESGKHMCKRYSVMAWVWM